MRRLLGFLFIVAVVVGVFGYLRGWWGVTTSEAGGKTEVKVTVDKDKVKADTKGVRDKVGKISRAVVAKIRGLAREISDRESQIEGKLQTIDVANRTLTVLVGKEAIELPLGEGVEIQQAGELASLSALVGGADVKITLEKEGAEQIVRKVEVTQ